SPNAKTENEIYLTCLGLSAEQGDDGQVGRGNRVSGLITPCREMSLEAAAGKNINHPGKLYQILSYILAQKISKIEGTKECTVKLLSQIGKPLDEPQVVSIKIKGKLTPAKIEKARKIVQETLDNLLKIQWEIAKGKYPVF
ncbi:methionine adenosyltransferase, partial [Candidatus Parcubacteria bacterium]|nr:methionine adenosyltransferase [Candidatus Parcubacteria bacterium]